MSDFTFAAGFIGAGNMGGALAQAALSAVPADRIAVICHTPEHTRAAAARLGCPAGDSNAALAATSRFLFLGVKPGMIGELAAEISSSVSPGTVLVSMLAGVSLSRLEELFGADRPILRIMPNTPCAIGQGVILCAPNAHVTAGDTAEFRTLMAGAGLIDELPEKLIDAAGTLTGCGPAFAYLFAEALADGGVACGLPRAKAQTYAAAMLRGSAAMVLETGKHPGELKDAVCSPGGTTIEGVAALERNGFRNAAIEAVRASFGKTAKRG